jgi:endonuclease YncB( thermonuclease family)
MQHRLEQLRRTGLAAMSVVSVLLGPAAATTAVAPDCVGETATAAIASVPDPRSLALKDNRVLRLAGIESFALLHPDPAAADTALLSRIAELAGGADLRLRIVSERRDRYGRLPALVVLGDGRLLQETLVGEGIAISLAFGPPLPCFGRLLAAEDAARRSERGFWAEAAVAQARPEALSSRIGRFAIFEGRVVSVGIRRAATYLNFGEKWSEDVTVEVRGRDRDHFVGRADLAAMSGQRVRVRGFLEERSGPAMVVNWPAQVEVLGAAGEPVDARPDGGTP